MNIVRWNPIREFDDLFARVGAVGPNAPGSAWRPQADVTEQAAHYRFELELPGVAAADIHVAVHDGVLSVSGERRSSIDQGAADSARVHRLERLSGKFARSFHLPADADPAAVTASCKDGVLTLDVARRQTTGRVIEVQAG